MNPINLLIDDLVLDEAGVDQVSGVLQDWMTQAKVNRKNVLRCRLAAESLLEDICVHFDRKLHVSVEARRRFGTKALIIRYAGDSYNPIEKNDADAWTSQLLSSVGLMPAWNYKRGVNEIVLKLPKNKLRSEILLLCCFAAAGLLGLLKPVLPLALTDILGQYVFSSVSTVFMGLLGTFAGVMVFLTVMSGICGLRSVADFSKIGGYLIGRNVLMSFLGSGICGVLMIPFFSFRFGEVGGESQASAILDMLLQIVPKDPISPFLPGIMLQIVFMSVFIGVVLVMFGAKTKDLRNLVLQANAVVLRLLEIVCKLLPLYVLSSLTLLLWENGMSIFRTIWKPMVFCIATCFALMAAKVLIVSVRCKVGPFKLFKKVLPGFLIALTTSSSTAAFGTVMEENEKQLGVNPQLSNFGFPVEMILSASTIGSGFLAIVYYLAEYNNIEVSVFWFVSAWVMITILSFSMPPIAGGTLVCLSVMLAQFNIPAACLGLAGTLSLFGDFFMTGSRVVISQLELVLEARHWNTLDTEKLRA